MHPFDKDIQNACRVSMVTSGSPWNDFIDGQNKMLTLWILSLSLLLHAYGTRSLLPDSFSSQCASTVHWEHRIFSGRFSRLPQGARLGRSKEIDQISIELSPCFQILVCVKQVTHLSSVWDLSSPFPFFSLVHDKQKRKQ